MRVADFDFHLPEELIAQRPPLERDGARMLTLDRATGVVQNRHFRDLPSLLRPGDLLILNDSRVLPARLFARRGGNRLQSGASLPSGTIEVLLTEELSTTEWKVLVKPGRKVHSGERLLFLERDGTLSADCLTATVTEEAEFGERTLRFHSADLTSALERMGHIPLPPYMHRLDDEDDRFRYQTVYADPSAAGSVAAPTAGLHFTPKLLDDLVNRGVLVEHVTLHVGLGTFQPVRAQDTNAIRLHRERYTLPQATAEALNLARQEGRRIVAVGTTSVRTLEHCAAAANLDTGTPFIPGTKQRFLQAASGHTEIFIHPGHRFLMVDALLTNFHLPQSTLLMLVSAFAGYREVMGAYRHAVQARFRFYSYGDCMFLS